jgi:hypothetical protein
MPRPLDRVVEPGTELDRLLIRVGLTFPVGRSRFVVGRR